MSTTLDGWLRRLPGKPTIRRETVLTPAVEALQIGMPSRNVGAWLNSIRWFFYICAVGAVGGAVLEFGPPKETGLTTSGQIVERTRPDAGLGWLFSGLLLIGAALAFAVACVWIARHLPHPAVFPDCPRCGRHEETKWARAEHRDLCRGCRRKLPLDAVLPAWRRSWRSL